MTTSNRSTNIPEIREIWAIYAKPSDKRHSNHYACYFSTEEHARYAMPFSEKSYDVDDNVHWYYSIVKLVNPKNIDASKLDIVPRHFPYTAW